MTRETDSSSSGPQGRGGAAYPSGTPPYGSRPFPSLHPQERTRPPGAPDDGSGGQDAATEAGGAAAPDEPRTETTLTTRIRINIPGSRPIPPVVVRTTVDEGAAAAAAAETAAQAAAAAEAEAPAEPEPEKTSDWFAPRKSAPAQPPAAQDFGQDQSTGGMPLPGGAPASPYGRDESPAGAPASPYGPDQQAGGAPASFFGQDPSSGGVPGGAPASPYGQDQSTGGMPLPVRTPGSGVPSQGSTPPGSLFGGGDAPTGNTPYLPQQGGPAPGEDEAARGSHDTPAGGFAAPFANEAPPFGAGSPFDTGAAPQGSADASPFGAGSPFDTAAMPVVPGDAAPYGAGGSPAADDGRSPYDTGATPVLDDGPSPYDTGATPVLDDGPSPYDTGATPVRGDGTSPYDTGANPAVNDARSPYDTGSQPFGTTDFPPGVPRPSEERAPGGEDPLGAPFGSTTGPATGAVNVPPLMPEAVRPPAGPSGFRPPTPGPRGGTGILSGDTLVGGIAAVPAGESRPARKAPPRAAAPAAEPEPAAARPAPAPARPAKKGRSKPVLLGVAAGGVLVVAYGAGLLMNHADVPKGTTVLGVDIGNQNREAAVKMLDNALGDRTTAPLSLTVGGRKQTLKPSVAGLSVDTDATVQQVAHADYNPVSVIGSLFGGSRTADPVFVMDEDKLKAALQSVAGKNSDGTDAMVRFKDGKAIGVPGKPRQNLDLAAASAQVEAAYRTRAETGADTSVALNAATAPPKVSQAELDKAVNGFGRTAMSGLVTVRANAIQKIKFSPNGTLPKFLTMRATADGKLAPHIDLDTLKGLYGKTFHDVLLKRPDGSKTAVTPDDVAKALIQALGATDPAGRTVTFPNLA